MAAPVSSGKQIPCRHCGTQFRPKADGEVFCCAGCDYVYRLIHDEGLEQFYDLKRKATVSPVKGRAFQARDYGWLAPLREAAEREAGEAGKKAATLTLRLQGISCIGCVWLIDRLFQRADGGLRIDINAQRGELRLLWEPGRFDFEEFARTLQHYGYILGEAGDEDGVRTDYGDLPKRLGLCGAFAMNAMAFTLPRYLGMPADFQFASLFELVAALSATLSILAGGSYFIRRSWQALAHRAVHIDTPISLGILTAYAGSVYGWLIRYEALVYFDFVAIFIFLMLAGRWLQIAAVEKNRNRLLRTSAVTRGVEVVDPETGESGTRPFDDLSRGVEFLVRPGQVVPVAGDLLGADASLSLEWINGESDARTVDAGRRVPSGAMNIGQESIRLRAEENWESSLLHRLAAVSESGATSHPLLDRVLKVYVLLVIVLGLAGGAVWLAATRDLPRSLQVTISLFVVSCPCALGVAVPLADDLAVLALERLGVCVRRRGFWPRILRVRKVLFDKTGTLTLENPRLLNPAALDSLGIAERDALVHLVSSSLHPVSRGLLEAIGEQWGRTGEPPDGKARVEETVGQGIEFVDGDGTTWSLGRPGWKGTFTGEGPGSSIPATVCHRRPAGVAEGPDTLPPELTGKMPVAHSSVADEASYDCEFRRGGEVVAEFSFVDSLREDAREEIGRLRGRGFGVFILSGDRQAKVDKMADNLGLDPGHCIGRMSPDEKAEWVSRVDEGDTLFIGDGANDSLAFEAAACTGTPAVGQGLLENRADFYFLSRSLSFLRRTLSVAGNRARAVRRVFGFAVVYNLAAAAVCLAGAMNPLLAAILMPLSSVTTVAIVSAGMPGKRHPDT